MIKKLMNFFKRENVIEDDNPASQEGISIATPFGHELCSEKPRSGFEGIRFYGSSWGNEMPEITYVTRSKTSRFPLDYC